MLPKPPKARFLGQARKRAQFTAILVVLTLFAGIFVQEAWAASYVGYAGSSCPASCFSGGICDNPTCTGSQCNPAANNCEAPGEVLIAPFAGTLQSISFFTTAAGGSNGLPNQMVILTASAGSLTHLSTPAGYCPTGGPGTTCGKEGAGDTFTIADVETLTGLSAGTFTTVLLAGTVTVSQGQYVAVLVQNTNNEALQIVGFVTQCPCLTTAYGTHILFQNGACPISGTNGAPVVGGNACSDVGPTAPPLVGATFIPSTAPVIQFAQCYGNCGSPAVTLANTNSTHTVAFNSSLTLFYEFQSNQNGFLLNVTANVAKNYINGQVLSLGIYTTTNNCIGSIPFSQACPGLLQFSKNVANPNKGQGGNSLIITGNKMPVANNQWIAIALSGLYAPLDINDTNTNVAIFQSQGDIPAVLSQTSTFSANYKMGLWAWINGNVVNGQPGTTVTPVGCPALDCILAGVVNSFCSNLTTACQSASSIFWVIILTAVTVLVFVYCLTMLVPNFNVGRFMLGDFAVLIFLGWLSLFGSLSLTAPWITVLVFLTVAWLFIGRLKGTGPI